LRIARLLMLAPALAGCAVFEGSVTRVYSGRAVEERYISPEAYSHYTAGAIAEAAGNDEAAAAEYFQAADEDPDSADIWTRLGAVHCRLKTGKSASLFERAQEIDSDYAPLQRERALCALQNGDAARARREAALAVALDPDDETASLVLGEAERRLGRRDEARRWLLALSLRDPSSSRAQAALTALDRGTAAKSPVFARVAPRRLAPARKTLDDVDRALSRGDAGLARSLALGAGISASTLALRAAAFGVTALAREEAERVLAADAGDSDAFVAALVAASLDHDEARFATLLTRLDEAPTPPSTLAMRLLAELVAARVGPEASQKLRESSALGAPADPLERRVEARKGQ
jgi:Tetratricopeptide repeat